MFAFRRAIAIIAGRRLRDLIRLQFLQQHGLVQDRDLRLLNPHGEPLNHLLLALRGGRHALHLALQVGVVEIALEIIHEWDARSIRLHRDGLDVVLAEELTEAN